MRLQRLGFYRFTRVLSAILPLAIAGFVGIAAWNYWSRTREPKPQAPRVEQLPQDVAVVTKDFSLTRAVDGKDMFTITADTALAYKDNRNVLKDVEVTIYSQQAGDPDRYIRGEECSHHQDTDVTSCTRNVSVNLDANTVARTEELVYDPRVNSISSPAPTTLARPGEMTGRAGRMEYLVDAGLLRLFDGVVIDLVEGSALRGGVAAFHQKENWATISQGIEMQSANGWVRGGSGNADLSPGTYRPTKITVENGASAEARSPASLFKMSSNWLQSDLSEDGGVQHVIARGAVHAENRAAAGEALSGALKGPEIEAWLDERGRVASIEARQNPQYTGPQGTLTADKRIRIDNRSLTLQTEGISTLTGEALSIDGRDFAIQESDEERVFSTAHRATLKASGQTSIADNTTARFDKAANKIAFLKQSGNVTFEEGMRTGRAGVLTVTVSDGGERIELEGNNPQIADPPRTLNARKITLNKTTGALTGDGTVRMTDVRPGADPLVVLAGHVEAAQKSVEYTGGVQLFPGNGKISADRIVAVPGENRFEAEGQVRSFVSQFQARSQTLIFVDSGQNGQTAHYTGNVWAEKTDKQGVLELETPDLEVKLKGGAIDAIVATQGVNIKQGTRTGKGTRAEYKAANGDVLLLGTDREDAEVRDPDGFVKACSILIKANGDKVFTPCSDRSIQSAIPLKK